MSYSDQPPPPPYGGQPGGYGGYGGAGGPVDHPRGTVVLILGILGLVCCGVLAPIAWVMGNTALKEIDANPQAYTNRGTVRAGQICGIVGTVLLVLGALLWIVLLATGAFTFSASTY